MTLLDHRIRHRIRGFAESNFRGNLFSRIRSIREIRENQVLAEILQYTRVTGGVHILSLLLRLY